jgi:hypothetical protein
MNIVALLKAKLLVMAVASVVVVGGVTAALAATPAGHQLFYASSNGAQATKTPHAADQQHQQGQANTCPGLADAQHLAAQYALSTTSQGNAVQAICALHIGAFKGTTPNGSSVSSDRVFGYGEIDQLLTYAQYLATHNKATSSSKLTDANVESFLAEALQSCGKSPIEQCLKDNIPNFQPGNGGGNDNGNGAGKPTGTPTPHH